MRHRPIVTILVAVGLCVGAVGAEAEEIVDRIDAYLAPFVTAGHLSGSLLVTRGEEVLFEGSFGLANRELEVPVGPDSRFCVASVTKPMTQIIALRLIESKVLATDDPISKWIPDFPRGGKITVDMLLRHEAGIPHRVTSDSDEALPQSAAGMVERAKRHELLFEPGSESAYSSAGYSVLARVLELATGKSYSELLTVHVFGPAAMTESIHPSGNALIPQRASSYQFGGAGELINSPLKNYSFLVGAGSVFSTPRDLQRLMRTVVEGGFGPKVSAHLLREGGLSWNGRTDGYRAFADYDADSGVYAAFVSNVLTGAGDLLRRDLPRLAAGEPVDPPAVPSHRAVAVDPDILRRYEGDYQLRPGTVLTLSVEGDEVRMSGWLLIPTSERTFFSPQDYGEITVVLAEDGSVERLDWSVGGGTYPMPQVVDRESRAQVDGGSFL